MSKAQGTEYCFWRPQSSEKVEKANDIIRRHLHKLTQETQDSWFKVLPVALMRTQTAPKKKELSVWQTAFVHWYCHRSWSLKLNYDSDFSLFNRHYWEVNSWPSLWVKQASVWARNRGGPENIRGLASADSKSTESNIWPSRQQLPVLGSLLYSTVDIIAGSTEHSPRLSIEDFPWWVSPLQGRVFLQLCDDI